MCYREYVENGFFKKNLKLLQRLRIKKLIRFGLPSKGRLKKQVEKFFSDRGLELVNAGMTREYLAEFKGEKKSSNNTSGCIRYSTRNKKR